ncbi:MAG TPA: phage baseplate assembly protein V [Mucilaginibacter sp.]|jgi:uncharacterized protein involved in type VI secretion and phage assembly
MSSKKYFGKYRAIVVNNADPEMRGRLMLSIPAVLKTMSSVWAEACAPLAGPSGSPMGVYMVPPVDTAVWAEFEQGNPDFPIWVGCRWSEASDIPPLAFTGSPVSPNIVIQSLGQNAFVINDLPGSAGGIVIKSTDGASITINDTGIHIQNGKGARIDMAGPSVNINNGAMVI